MDSIEEYNRKRAYAEKWKDYPKSRDIRCSKDNIPMRILKKTFVREIKKERIDVFKIDLFCEKCGQEGSIEANFSAVRWWR